MLSRRINRLKIELARYLFFWEEWKRNGNCNLNPEDIHLIDYCLSKSFETELINLSENSIKVEKINSVIKKLELGYQVFKDFVVVNFFQTTIECAREYGYDKYLNTPISQLEIDEDFKNCLLKFNCHTLKLVFVLHKAEDFCRGWLYKNIIEFQTIKKTKSTVYINKPEFT